MAYSIASTSSYQREIDPDLKGSVDFDFFSPELNDKESNNNAFNTKNSVISQQNSHSSVSKNELQRTSSENQPANQQNHNNPKVKKTAISQSSFVSPMNSKASAPLHSDSDSESYTDSSYSQSPSRSPSPLTKRNVSPTSTPRSLSPGRPKSRLSSRSSSPSRQRSPRSSLDEDSHRTSSHEQSEYSTDIPLPNGDDRIHRTAGSSVSSSESDVTDVSPLSSPYGSPVLSPESRRRMLDDVPTAKGHTRGNRMSKKREPSPEKDQDALNVEMIVRALLELDQPSDGPRRRQNQSQPVPLPTWTQVPGGRPFSFTAASGGSKGDPTQTKPKKPSGPVYTRPYHSTINRQKDQRRIEQENKALLRRLQTIRPTKNLTRNDQLNHYQRQSSYGAVLMRPSSAAAAPITVKSRPGSAASIAAVRSQSHRPDGARRHSDHHPTVNVPLRRTQSTSNLAEAPDQRRPSSAAAMRPEVSTAAGRKRPNSAKCRLGESSVSGRVPWPKGW